MRLGPQPKGAESRHISHCRKLHSRQRNHRRRAPAGNALLPGRLLLLLRSGEIRGILGLPGCLYRRGLRQIFISNETVQHLLLQPRGCALVLQGDDCRRTGRVSRQPRTSSPLYSGRAIAGTKDAARIAHSVRLCSLVSELCALIGPILCRCLLLRKRRTDLGVGLGPTLDAGLDPTQDAALGAALGPTLGSDTGQQVLKAACRRAGMWGGCHCHIGPDRCGRNSHTTIKCTRRTIPRQPGQNA